MENTLLGLYGIKILKGTFRFVGRFFCIICPHDMKFGTDMKKHSGIDVKKKNLILG